MSQITELNFTEWQPTIEESTQEHLTQLLEQGKVLYLPSLAFILNENEKKFLSPEIATPEKKNLSFDIKTKEIRGAAVVESQLPELQQMMQRYATYSYDLVKCLFPHYVPNLQVARTSYRPVEIKGRLSSYRKDDTRLHVDAYPSTPIGNQRIMRVFSNVNPNNQPRYWRLGAPFNEVSARFIPDIRKPFPGEAKILKAIKVTRGLRTHYDHYMTHIHNKMKKDMAYQNNVSQEAFYFPSGSTWIVFTDQVSHAAMTGQYLFEQSFYLPVDAMLNPQQSPLRVLEKLLGSTLI